MITSNFFPMITAPTRYSNNNGTLIDNIFCQFNYEMEIKAGILNSCISDHHPYFLVVNKINPPLKSPKYITINTYNIRALSNLKEELNTIDYSNILDLSLNANPDKNYELFLETLSTAIDKHLPTKIVKFDKKRHKKSDWITSEIIKSINYRDKMYKNLRTATMRNEECTILKQNLKVYNAILKKAIKEAKKSYYDNCFMRVKNDTKRTWSIINSILGRSKDKKKFPIRNDKRQ